MPALQTPGLELSAYSTEPQSLPQTSVNPLPKHVHVLYTLQTEKKPLTKAKHFTETTARCVSFTRNIKPQRLSVPNRNQMEGSDLGILLVASTNYNEISLLYV
jgi:hypothetical protein